MVSRRRRNREWKLLCEYDGSDAQLFDLSTDRGETKNVAAAHQKIVANLTATLLSWHNSMPQDNGASLRSGSGGKPRKN